MTSELKQYEKQESASNDDALPADPQPEEIEEKHELQDDFLELYETNDHIIGWLTAGEQIDYPVVQHDNDFYLTHNFYREPDSNGTIFMNECNSLFPRDDVLLIHGHNMIGGKMFGLLSRFEYYDYLCQYPVVTFRTIYDEVDVFYTPIAAFNASMMKSDPEYFNVARILFENDPGLNAGKSADGGRKSKEFQNYLDELDRWTLWKPKTDVTVDDILIVLITCSYYQDDGRFMLFCRALRDGETPEMIKALYDSETDEKAAG